MKHFFYQKIVLVILIIIGPTISSNAQKIDYKNPNVVFIISDQHKKKASGCYGSDMAITPNIDRAYSIWKLYIYQDRIITSFVLTECFIRLVPRFILVLHAFIKCAFVSNNNEFCDFLHRFDRSTVIIFVF